MPGWSISTGTVRRELLAFGSSVAVCDPPSRTRPALTMTVPASRSTDDSPQLRDLPTIRWSDPESVAALTEDIDTLTRQDAARVTNDWREAERLQPDAFDASLRMYAVIPGEDEATDEWRARAARLPVEPKYLNLAATW